MPGKQRRQTRGFTLIEILVTVVVIGVVIGMATLAIGDRGAVLLKEETQRLTALIRLTQEEAILQSQDLGMGFWDNGYAFFKLTDKVDEERKPIWDPLQDDILRQRNLPEGMEFDLTLEGLDIVMKAIPVKRPQVFFMSSGEITPFTLDIALDDRISLELSSDGLGSIEQSELEVVEN